MLAVLVSMATLPSALAQEPTEPAEDTPPTRERAPNLPLTNVRPTLTFGIFGDTAYSVEQWDEAGESQVTNSFEAATMDLFTRASVGANVSFVGEVLFEFEDGMPMADVERALVVFNVAPWLRIQAGRGHTPLGYWNETFHHGMWLQTTVTRPVVVNFEGGGGFLPTHYIGVGAAGEVSILHYNLIVANGRAADPAEVLVAADVDNGKQVTAELTVQPMPGFGFGVAGIVGGIPEGLGHGRMEEQILGLHVFQAADPIEVLGEVFAVRHTDADTAFLHLGAYAQLAYTAGSLKPYYRFDWVGLDEKDPYYLAVTDAHRHSVGLRWDFEWFCALKAEFSRGLTGRKANRLTTQVSFAF